MAAMRIICVHQGFELYGSDRSFIESVTSFRDAWPQADIEVVLPCEGPIVAPLRAIATRVVIGPVFVLRRRGFPKLVATAPFRLLPALWRAARRMRAADLIYVNTVVVLDYLLIARIFSARTLVHVHEIPDGLKLKFFRVLLAWTRAEMIFNSKATRAAYRLRAGSAQHVVYNGIAAPSVASHSRYEGKDALRILMLGRISRIKGQDLLIEALARLPTDIVCRLEVRIVGDSFNNDVTREATLRAAIQAAGLDATVHIEPFQSDPAPLYRWAHIVVVPSRLPESLGRVAIEAMAFGRPPLVVNLGGLTEIVEDGVTGWVLPPNNADALAHAIEKIATQPGTWSTFGGAARARFEAVFDSRVIRRQFQSIARVRLTGRESKATAHGLARI